MSKCRFAFVTLVLFLLTGSAVTAQWSSLAQDGDAESRIVWWPETRFGMFLHWGVYAIPGRGEWVQWNEQIPVREYAMFADQFKPERFDPDGVSTHKGNAIYVHVLQAPKDLKRRLPALPARVTRAAVLHGAQSQCRHSEHGLEIDLPAASVDAIDPILKLDLEQPSAPQAVIPVPASWSGRLLSD